MGAFCLARKEVGARRPESKKRGGDGHTQHGARAKLKLIGGTFAGVPLVRLAVDTSLTRAVSAGAGWNEERARAQ
jgi:hypothetical protein